MLIQKVKNKVSTYLKNRNIIEFQPTKFKTPEKLLEINSAWTGLESIITDILIDFEIPRNNCLEFGVEFGYSTVAFSNFFEKVIGIDTFEGDIHTMHKGEHYQKTSESLAPYTNIQLIQSDYRDWIKKDDNQYDLIHVDIVHTYEATFKCGLWSAQHSKCTLFHDTESFLDVRWAVYDIAKATGKKFYNYPKHYGLGIIV